MSEVPTSQTSEIENGSQEISIVHVTIPNQPVQVQSVIQSSHQPSVIQTTGPNVQTIQVATVNDDMTDGAEGRKRREILARRPSYRKILNELSSECPPIKIEEPTNQDGQETTEAASNLSTNSIQYQPATVYSQMEGLPLVPSGAIQITTHPEGTVAGQGLQTLTMTNANPSSGAGTTSGTATIVQYAQGPDGQFLIPVTVGGTNVQAYQIATSLPQGVVMATTGSPITSPQQLSEEAARKRELRLLKNR
ncbi:cAMP-responsive element modulator isoform X3 [Octopus bimaculoides]|nr:cAMP-responsive element modulator isoform X3 [Octopus bimaculoides]